MDQEYNQFRFLLLPLDATARTGPYLAEFPVAYNLKRHVTLIWFSTLSLEFFISFVGIPHSSRAELQKPFLYSHYHTSQYHVSDTASPVAPSNLL